ncbi:MAG: hypothetical protein IKU00_09715 [Bacteroidales bacterium]|nr:hypothetical protein [Bacteroidales bacterium]
MNRILILTTICFLGLSVSASENDKQMYRFSWSSGGKERECSLLIDNEVLNYYRNHRDHLAYRYSGVAAENAGGLVAYFGFMFSELGSGAVKALAAQLVNAKMSDVDKIQETLAFVQSLPYAYDKLSKGRNEYVRYPVETLADGRGDCEDKAILLGALLHEMNVDFVLLSLPDHVAIGVCCEAVETSSYLKFDDKKYCYLETTAPGWEIGQIPDKYASSVFEVVPVRLDPVLIVKSVNFESDPALMYQKADCALKLDLQNIGPHAATGLQLVVRVVGDNNQILMSDAFLLDDMPEGVEKSQMVRFKYMVGKGSLLQMTLMGDNIVDQQIELKLHQRSRRGRY